MSDEIKYLTCPCDNCGQNLEFPAEGVGTEIQCPTCGMITLLHSKAPIPVPAPIRLARSASGRDGQRKPFPNIAFASIIFCAGLAAGIWAVKSSKPVPNTGQVSSLSSNPASPVAEPPSESTEVITFADPPGLDPNWTSFRSQFEVQIDRILIGPRAIEEGKVYSSQLDDPQKELVYFQVSVKNIGCRYEWHVYGMNFQLIDNSGYSYTDIQPRDYIQGMVMIDTIVQGGIAFAIRKGARPEKLIFDTGLVRTLGADRRTSSWGSARRI